MKPHNPFPGMNPWMQNIWSDVHTALIGYIRDALGLELPDDLTARAEETIRVQEDATGEVSIRRADVGVLQTETWRQGIAPVWTPEDDPALADRLAVPVLVEKIVEPITPRWVEIRERDGKLITVIEVTSPQNKTKSGRRQFESKLGELLSAGVNVVEIDLIRGGIAAKDFEPQGWPMELCQIIVQRAAQRQQIEVYPCPLREPLPAVRIPLRAHEPDAALDLQPLINRCHTLGRYWLLNYQQPPAAELTEEETAWAREIAG